MKELCWRGKINAIDGVGSVGEGLLTNPFVVLGIPQSASATEIADAFEDRLHVDSANESGLREARRLLVSPKQRLSAELSAFPDAAPQEMALAVELVATAAPHSDLLRLARSLPAASRANLLSYLCSLDPSVGMLRAYAEAWMQVDLSNVRMLIARAHRGAGISEPTFDALSEAWESVSVTNEAALFRAYKDPSVAASDLAKCLSAAKSATSDELVAYARLTKSFSNVFSSAIDRRRLQIDEAMSELRAAPSNSDLVRPLETALTIWDGLVQPLQMLDEAKGRDEPESRLVFEALRGLAIELANEHNQPEVALQLTKIASSIFAELPRAKSQLDEDDNDLRGLILQKRIGSLLAFTQKARLDMRGLAAEVNRNGFGPRAAGKSGELYRLFDESVVRTEGTEGAEIPWGLVRGLAIDLNNDFGEGEASGDIIAGLVAHPRFINSPSVMRDRVRADLLTVRSNEAETKLGKLIALKDLQGAEAQLASMITNATSDTQRASYETLRSTIKGKLRERKLTLWWWGFVAVFVVGAFLFQTFNSHQLPASQQPGPGRPTQPARPSQPLSPTNADQTQVETIPPRGSGLEFSRANIRYCLYSGARLDAIKTGLGKSPSDGVIGEFNAAVDDWNSRCANFRYFEEDLQSVEAEVRTKAAELNSQGLRTLRLWKTLHP